MALDATKPTDQCLVSEIPAYIREDRVAINAIVGGGGGGAGETYTGIFNVKDPPYNAVGDDIVDDTAAIQDAIDDARAANRGGIVYLPSGWYRTSAALSIASANNVHLVGAGPDSTVIRVTGNYNAVEITGVCSHCGVEDLLVYSTVAQGSSSGGISVVGTGATSSDNIKVLNVDVQNLQYPFFFDYCGFRLERCRVTQSVASSVANPLKIQRSISCAVRDLTAYSTVGKMSSAGLILESDTDSITFDRVEMLDMTDFGIILRNTVPGGVTGPRLIDLTNCYIEGSLTSGFAVSAGRIVRFNHCTSAVNAGNGFFINGGDSIQLFDCTAMENSLTGFMIGGGTGVGIIGCTGSNNSQAAHNTYSGVYLNYDGVRVEGGRFGDFIYTETNKQQYGIVIATAIAYSIVTGNDCRGNQTAGILNLGAVSGIVEHNQV